MIPAKESFSKHKVTIHGLQMAYVNEGKGDPIIFLHGNPSSSYEWRNVIPHLVGMRRCIAPDLIGMGDSDKLPSSGPSSYRFIEHRKYLDAIQNFVVENILPAAVLRKLSDDETNVYRRPYKNPGESRRPTLTWPREIPIAGQPNDVCDIIQTYSTWLSSSQIPKLFIEAIPGAMFQSHRDFAKTWPNQTHVKIRGGHFVSEDSPDETGTTIATWLKKLKN